MGDPATAAVIELQAVGRRFGSDPPVDALVDVNLSINRGQWLAIVGPSGSGKSTLLNVLGCLDRQTSGTFFFDGIDVGALTDRQRAGLRSRGIGFVFQSFHLMPTMTAHENVMAPLEIARQDRIRERATEALTLVGLEHRLTHYPGQLSGGEKQRVAVARALAVGPDMIFADEPTGNLDTAAGGMIADFLFEASRERGAALVLVTHDRDLAQRADRVVEMRDGSILT